MQMVITNMEVFGNGTRINSNDYVLVGDRNIRIDNITSIMEVGDVEEIEINGNPFNVFRDVKVSIDEYEWFNDNEVALNVQEGKITAKAEGIAHITITDKLTNRQLELTRVILDKMKDRIEEISVNGIKATLDENSTEDNLVYRVKVVTDSETGMLKITTKNKTDRISIDEGTTWQINGELLSEVALLEKITQIPIKIGIQNNQGEYPLEENATLIVEKLSDDTSITEVTVTSKEEGIEKEVIATLVLPNRYEVIISDDTEVTISKVLLNCEYSEISIDGMTYSLHEQSKNIDIGNELKKEIKLHVKSEAGREEEYTLAIYKESLLTRLLHLTVDGKEAEKITEEEYTIAVSADKQEALVKAETYTHLVEVSVDGNDYKVLENQAVVNLPNDETEIIIRTKTKSGEIKEYKLTIVKMSQNTNLDRVTVDGEEAILKEDGKYHYSLKEAKKIVDVIAYTEDIEQTGAYVKIEDNEYNLHEDTKTIAIFTKETEVKIYVKAENGNLKEHILVIEGLSDDTTIKQVIVNGENAKFVEGENRYEIKLAGDEFEIEVTLNDLLASLKLGTNNETIGTDNITVSKTGEETLIEVQVISQSKLVQEKYVIAILEKSSNTGLEKVIVNGKKVNKNELGEYKIGLEQKTTEIDVEATAEDIASKTTINGNTNNSFIANIKENVVEGKNIYEYTIIVTSELGDMQEYVLYVEILEANYGILKVEVGEDEQTLEEAILRDDGNYYMKINNVEAEFVKVTLESEKSKVKIDGVLRKFE